MTHPQPTPRPTAEERSGTRQPSVQSSLFRPLSSQGPSSSMTLPSELSSPTRQHHPHPAFYEGMPLLVNEPALPWPASYDLSAYQHESPNYHFAQQYSHEPNDGYFYPSRNHHNLAYPHGYQTSYLPLSSDAACPRSYPGLDSMNSMGTMADAYPPSAYQLEPQKPVEYLASLDSIDPASPTHLENEYDFSLDTRMKVEGSDMNQYSHSNYGGFDGVEAAVPGAMPGSPSTFGDTMKEPSLEEASTDREEPYAKLIYRCLMETPGHCMVLRDIYEWFRQRTDKATNKETKGWQNSIRHNLSMNGAFQKVDQPPGEEAKKGFMWRLTQEAIDEGVKSTTRYRSKQPNKRTGRPHHPAPQRQASGAKGGQAAKKAARLRRSERLRESRSPHAADMFSALPTSVPRSDFMDACSPSELGALPEMAAESPYFLAGCGPFTPLGDESGSSIPPSAGSATTPTTPASFHFDDGSLPGTPGSGPEYVHLFDCNPGEPLFYSSPESTNEPRTPPSYADMQMGTSCFFDTDLLI